MENTPLVSVAMVTYNSEEYVSEAINSVLSSDYSNFELVICDDCSNDNTWKIINSFNDRRIKKTRNEKNIGEYNNRNKCLKLAIGEYIIYIDGDDKIYPHALSFFVNSISKYSQCAFAISRPHDFRFYYPHYLPPANSLRLHYFDKTVLDMALVRVFFNRKILLSEGGFSNQYKAGDDFIRLKLAFEHPILLINDGLVWWRKRPNQASERLKSSFDGCLEPFLIELFLLNKNKSLLSNKELIKIIKRIRRKLYHSIFILIKRGHFLNAYKLWQTVIMIKIL